MPKQPLTLNNIIKDTIKELTKSGVTIEYPAEIKDYLTKYPCLIESLGLARKKASVVFKKEKLYLDMYSDPEEVSADDYLYLNANIPLFAAKENVRKIRSVNKVFSNKKIKWYGGCWFDFGPREKMVYLSKYPKTQHGSPEKKQ